MSDVKKDKAATDLISAGFTRQTRNDTVVYTKTLPPVQPLPSEGRPMPSQGTARPKSGG